MASGNAGINKMSEKIKTIEGWGGLTIKGGAALMMDMERLNETRN